MLKKDTLAIVAAVIIAALIIGGSILHLSGRLFEHSEALALRAVLARTEAMLDGALRTLHHERLMHFGTFDADAEAETVSGDVETEEKSGR